MPKGLFLISVCILSFVSAMAQERSNYAGLPSVRYQGSKHGSLYASLTQYQGAKAIVYEAGFQPSKGWGVSGILSGGKTAYFGKLYVTADQVSFVSSREKDQKMDWSVKRSDFSVSMTQDGLEIKPSHDGAPHGLVHFQPVENKTGKLEFDQPDEPSFLHKGHLDPPMDAFINDFNAGINSFNDAYGRLAGEAGTD